MARVKAVPMTWRGHVRELLRNPAMVVWILFILLGPLYLVASGLPQPGDMLVFLLVPSALLSWDRRLDRDAKRIVVALVLFTLWVCLVNYAWATVLWRWTKLKDFVIHPFFYIFNLAVFVAALVIARPNRERFLRITVDVVFLTIVVQVVGSFVYRTDFYRGQVFFNSPNQLGFYALLSACLFAMTQRPLRINRLRAAIGVTCCAYLAMLSASRSSVAGILVLLLVLLVSNPRTLIIGALIAVGLVSIGGPVSDAIDRSEQRATTVRDPKTSFAEERGYDRIWNNPEYLVVGAGEGAYGRFAKPGQVARELHSSFGSVLFAYGIVGVALFLTFFLRVIRGAPLRMTLMLVPALVYTVAHQGLRFTMFWVVLAAFVVLKGLSPELQVKHGGKPQRA